MPPIYLVNPMRFLAIVMPPGPCFPPTRGISVVVSLDPRLQEKFQSYLSREGERLRQQDRVAMDQN
uniref:Uncharacterized protein n=1 Tax=Oryza brachyantha TaxID=4533 RepID=J3MAU8_ORYBR